MNTVHNGLSFSEGFLMDMTFLSTIVVCVHDREQARTFQQITSGNCLKASYPELGRGSSASSQLGMGPSVHAHGSFELSGQLNSNSGICPQKSSGSVIIRTCLGGQAIVPQFGGSGGHFSDVFCIHEPYCTSLGGVTSGKS